MIARVTLKLAIVVNMLNGSDRPIAKAKGAIAASNSNYRLQSNQAKGDCLD